MQKTQIIIDTNTITKALKANVSFAIWSYPNDKKTHHTFCDKNSIIKTYSPKNIDKHKGFVFAPFQVCKHLPIYILPFTNDLQAIDFSEGSSNQTYTANKESYTNNLDYSKIEHVNQVNNFISVFKNTDVKKAVLSRNKWIADHNISQMPALFDELIESYPNAFIYQVFIPEVGYWVGATPEVLLSSSNGRAKTVSLAGTQSYKNNEEIVWNHKEQIEQELVTEHIRTVLSEFNISDFKETGPETSKAGQLVHIKTLIDFDKTSIAGRFGEFIEKLHPTPAVCGLPVKDSLELILETEGYDREYYTGYLGPFNKDGKIDLFVNLRCLQAFENGVVLYAGGGITAESDAENEWEETRLKIQTLEQILDTL